MKRRPRKNRQSIFIFVGCVVVSMIFIFLFWIIEKGNQKLEEQRLSAETQRANQLQLSLDSLRARSDQDVKFFELVRQLITSKDVQQHQALLKQLKSFKFVEPTLPATAVPANPSTAIHKSAQPSSPTAATTTSTTRPKPPHKSRPPPTTTTTATTTTTTRPVVCLTIPTTPTTPTTLCK